MSLLAKLAWPVQIAVFLLLLFLLPSGPYRLPIIFGYIAVSTIAVMVIRRAGR